MRSCFLWGRTSGNVAVSAASATRAANEIACGSGLSPRATTMPSSRSAPRGGAIRLARSASQNRNRAPQSRRPYSSSSPVHQALSGTTTAPADAAQKATDHSGSCAWRWRRGHPCAAPSPPPSPAPGARTGGSAARTTCARPRRPGRACHRARDSSPERRAATAARASRSSSRCPGCCVPSISNSAPGWVSRLVTSGIDGAM
jgi:hypothetical protein